MECVEFYVDKNFNSTLVQLNEDAWNKARIDEGNFSKDTTLENYINLNFNNLGHFCIDDNTYDFYLKDQLLILEKKDFCFI